MVALVLVGSTPGCAGRASLHTVPLNTRKLSTSEPLVHRVDPRECYYWINDAEKLCVAMRFRNRSLFGKALSRDMVLSLVLEEPPAGPARSYSATRRTLRAVDHAGFTHLRTASLAGMVTVWKERRALCGRFRLAVKQQSWSVLSGWSGDNRLMLVGEFHAVANCARGEALLVQTEEGAMQRDAVPDGVTVEIPLTPAPSGAPADQGPATPTRRRGSGG